MDRASRAAARRRRAAARRAWFTQPPHGAAPARAASSTTFAASLAAARRRPSQPAPAPLFPPHPQALQSNKDLSTFTKLAEYAGLRPHMNSTFGHVTIFAPTNAVSRGAECREARAGFAAPRPAGPPARCRRGHLLSRLHCLRPAAGAAP